MWKLLEFDGEWDYNGRDDAYVRTDGYLSAG